MTKSSLSSVMRVGGGILVVAGLGALAWCAFFIVRAHQFQARAEAALVREALHPPAEVPTVPWEGQVLGSLSIPRVGISSVILEGTDDHTLALSVGHIVGTALPGQNGNIGLAAHRDTLFRGLRNIRDGDRILLTTPREVRIYEVQSTKIVSPDDVGVLNNTGQPLLTLVTCYPFYYIGSAPDRFIVQARPVSGSAKTVPVRKNVSSS